MTMSFPELNVNKINDVAISVLIVRVDNGKFSDGNEN